MSSPRQAEACLERTLHGNGGNPYNLIAAKKTLQSPPRRGNIWPYVSDHSVLTLRIKKMVGKLLCLLGSVVSAKGGSGGCFLCDMWDRILDMFGVS